MAGSGDRARASATERGESRHNSEHERTRVGAIADQQTAVTVERGIARGELRPGNDPRWVLEALIVASHRRTLLTGSPWTRTSPDPDRPGPGRRGDTGRQRVAEIR
ncbi:TetR/AcrR family transcriptional regulator C-terminal ligand-binding domain-containing protein [Streptomyces celluloflavus]|uniref:TetR/AcrR family transcriptional regulator C-terminal ligand-binding domain-containing protein n=1 Tax=Streptomyces celluloflavus TaxID=58344 RepID=UPI0037B1B953